MTRRGFALVEMLGVIVIIAVLAAILFPVFAKAREEARTHACRTNLLNIGMALRLYAADHDGWYPPTEDDLFPLMPRYITDARVFACPSSARIQAVTVPSAGGGQAAPQQIQVSYYYRGGRRHNQLPRAPLVSEYQLAHTEGANVLFSDGTVVKLPEAEWRDLGFRTYIEMHPELAEEPEEPEEAIR